MTDAAAAEPTKTDRPAELQAPAYEIFIGLLAVISLFNLAVSILPFSEIQKEIAKIVDVPLTLIFLRTSHHVCYDPTRSGSTSSSSAAGSTCSAACRPSSGSSGSSASSG